MFPVPCVCIKERIIKNEVNIIRRNFLNKQLQFCIDNENRIMNQAKRIYNIITKKLNPFIIDKSCDFLLLERLMTDYKCN